MNGEKFNLTRVLSPDFKGKKEFSKGIRNRRKYDFSKGLCLNSSEMLKSYFLLFVKTKSF